MLTSLLALSLLAIAPQDVEQDARAANPWSPFIGCWSPATALPSDEQAPASDATTCILPVESEPLSADVVEYEGGAEQRRSRLRADGTLSVVQSAGCVGNESARFAMDGARVFVRGTVACTSGTVESVVAVFEITSSGRLLHVRGHDDAVNPRLEFTSFNALASAELPQALRSALQPLDASAASRRAASARRTIDAEMIAEATRSVPAAVAEIWIASLIVDGAQALEMNESTRAELRGADVPARVVSLLEALAEPHAYYVAFSASGATTYQMTEGENPRYPSYGSAGSNYWRIEQSNRGQSATCRDLIGIVGSQYGNVNSPNVPASTAIRLEMTCPGALNLAATMRAFYGAPLPTTNQSGVAQQPGQQPSADATAPIAPVSEVPSENASPRPRNAPARTESAPAAPAAKPAPTPRRAPAETPAPAPARPRDPEVRRP